jgi:hypothetical protein
MEAPQKYIKIRTTIYNPASPLLDIYLKKVKSIFQRDICTSMFIAKI